MCVLGEGFFKVSGGLCIPVDRIVFDSPTFFYFWIFDMHLCFHLLECASEKQRGLYELLIGLLLFELELLMKRSACGLLLSIRCFQCVAMFHAFSLMFRQNEHY